MKPIVIKNRKDHHLLSNGSNVFIKSITKEDDVYSGYITNVDCNQNLKINPAATTVYYNKKDINGIFLEKSTGNELHSIFHYKILGVEIEMVKENPMSFKGVEI